jgi:hypothetical protein
VLGSASSGTGTEGLLTFLVGVGVSSNSRSLACSVSSGCSISFLWLIQDAGFFMLKTFTARAKLANKHADNCKKVWCADAGMSQQNSSSPAYSEERSRERLQMIDTLKAPIIQMGRDLSYEVIENYDLGAGPVHITWVFKPGSESLPDMRLGFICLTEFSNSSINEGIARAMLNLVDKLVFVVPTETMTKEVKDAIESMPDTSILQLRKYITVLTPSTLVSKQGIKGARERNSAQTGGEVV